MKIQTRVVDKDKNTTYNFVLTCSDEDFQAGRELAPDDMEQVDVLVKINGQEYKFSSDEFKHAMQRHSNYLLIYPTESNLIPQE